MIEWEKGFSNFIFETGLVSKEDLEKNKSAAYSALAALANRAEAAYAEANAAANYVGTDTAFSAYAYASKTRRLLNKFEELTNGRN